MEDTRIGFLGSLYGQHSRWGVFDEKGISPTLTEAMGSGGGHTPMTVNVKQATKEGVIPCEVGGVCDLNYPDSKTRRGRVQGNGQICPTLTTENIPSVLEEWTWEIDGEIYLIRIRKLTPRECWRLMGFTDEDFDKAQEVNSNTQLYKQAGNSIVVPVLEGIFRQLIEGRAEMTREEAIEVIKEYRDNLIISPSNQLDGDVKAFDMAIQALSQEPCELLIIKSDIFLHQDDRKKWMESIKREKESGVIILPPYFEPLLVPANIEINIEQEPCDDAVSREAVLDEIDATDRRGGFGCKLSYTRCRGHIEQLPPVTQKSGKWIKHPEIETSTPEYLMFYECSECGDKQCFCKSDIHKKRFCSNCGAKMVEPQESEVRNETDN